MSEEKYENIRWRDTPPKDGRYKYISKINKVTVRSTEQLEPGEAEAYVLHAQELFNDVRRVNVEVYGEEVELSYDLKHGNFERIRRITGYLVGSLDRFNDAKRQEESMRVKHNVTRDS